MKNLIWGAIGLIIMAVAAINLKNMLRLKKRGVTVLAEVIDVAEITRGKNKQVDGYTHTMRFEFDGKTVEAADRTGYNTAFKIGSKQLIVCDPEDPEKFEYEDALKKNITLFAVMLAVTIVFSTYWIVLGVKSM